MKKHLPNFFTLLNLTLGCLGALWALQGDLTCAAWCLWLGAIADFLDGFLARLLQAHSPLGQQLDSLADLMTFGWLPASIMYQLLSQYTTPPLPYVALLLPIFAALRLARFNLDTRQRYTFSGLPTPAQGLLVSTLPPVIAANQHTWLAQPYPLALLVVLLALLMVAPIQFIAFKFTTYTWRSNRLKYTLLLVTILLTLFFRTEGLALSLLAYIAISVYTTLQSNIKY